MYYKKPKTNQTEVFRVRKPQEGEILGIIEAMMGTNKVKVRCQDDKIRLCRIPGKMRKRVWMRVGNVILIKPWDIQGDTHADVLARYRPAEATWLRKRGFLTLEV